MSFKLLLAIRSFLGIRVVLKICVMFIGALSSLFAAAF